MQIWTEYFPLLGIQGGRSTRKQNLKCWQFFSLSIHLWDFTLWQLPHSWAMLRRFQIAQNSLLHYFIRLYVKWSPGPVPASWGLPTWLWVTRSMTAGTYSIQFKKSNKIRYYEAFSSKLFCFINLFVNPQIRLLFMFYSTKVRKKGACRGHLLSNWKITQCNVWNRGQTHIYIQLHCSYFIVKLLK